VSGRIDLLYDIEPKTGFMLIDTLLSDEPEAFWDALHHMILPAIVLGTIPLAVIARMTRSSMLEVLREDYIRTARAKGLSPARVVFVHGLRNALIPVLTVVGLQVGTLLAGACTDRNHLLVAGHRQMADRSHWRPGLSRGAKRHPANRLPGDSGQLRGGHPLRLCQPSHPSQR
jgi:hypothetical protein